MIERIAKQYTSLYEQACKFNNDVAEDKDKRKLTICPAIAGSDYQKGGIMVVGRAINGWCPLQGSVVEHDIIERLKRCESCTLDWVVGKNTWEHCKASGCPFANDDRVDGRSQLTPFWQMTKFICAKHGIKEEEWYKKIVWSNLYKVSYEGGGNPVDFYDEQIEECEQILIEEIKEYNPSMIYFITESSEKRLSPNMRTWFCKSYKDTTLDFKDVYEYLRDNNMEDIVRILVRPEFRIKSEVWEKKKNLNGEDRPGL